MKKKDNDIKEEEYYTSIIDGKFVVEAEGGAEKYALNAVSLFEALKIPPQNAATLRHSTGNTHKAEPDSSGPPRPPDLQELVARHGGYSSITPEAWAEWDRLNAEWKSARARYYGQTIKISVGRA